jgi:hypothetical protein
MTSTGGVSEKVMDEWFEAAGRGMPDVQTLKRLLDEHKGKLDINAADQSDFQSKTALGYATEKGLAKVVGSLLRRGADVNKYCSKDLSVRPLWIAAREGHAKVASALIAGGADVNEATTDAGSPTALHAAAEEGHDAVVRVLLESGADASIRNKKGKTAGQVAAEEDNDEAVAVFMEFASKPSGTGRPTMPELAVFVFQLFAVLLSAAKAEVKAESAVAAPAAVAAGVSKDVLEALVRRRRP